MLNRKNLLLWISFAACTTLLACGAEISRDEEPERDTEEVRIVVLENDRIDSITGLENALVLSPSTSESMQNFDALLISQKTFDNLDGNESIRGLVEFASENELLVIENEPGTTTLNIPGERYNTQVSSSLPVISTTITSNDAQAMYGVVLGDSLSSNGSASIDLEDIKAVVQNFSDIEEENLYEPLSQESIRFSVASLACPYRNYLEVVEVSNIESSAISTSEDIWHIRLSQLLKEASGDCKNADRMKSVVELESVNSNIADYAPTTGPGTQTADLVEDYSWTVGQSDMDIVDIGETPDIVSWLFDFQDTSASNSYFLTQPGLLAYLSNNSSLDLKRTVELGGIEIEELASEESQNLALSWFLNVRIVEE